MICIKDVNVSIVGRKYNQFTNVTKIYKLQRQFSYLELGGQTLDNTKSLSILSNTNTDSHWMHFLKYG